MEIALVLREERVLVVWLGIDLNASYNTILTAIAPVFLILLSGWGLRQTRILKPESDESLMQVVVKLFYPCLIFRYVAGNPTLQDAGNIWMPPLIGFFTIGLGFAVAYYIGPLIGLEVGKGRRSFAFTNGIYNYGYLPIPLVAAIFPDAMGVLLVHNVGVEVCLWTVGIFLITGTFGKGWLPKIFNPPLIALLLALVYNSFGGEHVVPGWVFNTARIFGDCAVPVGLLLAGTTLHDLKVGPHLMRPIKVPLATIAVRLAILPLAFLLLARYLPYASQELRIVIVIQAAMPAGIFPIVLARHYGGDPRVAVQVVFTSTLVSFLTIPLWVSVGLKWIGG